MRWPGQGQLEARIADLETRAQSYSDALTTLIVNAQTNGVTAIPQASAALEGCAGLIGRAFASATVEADENIAAVLSPSCLSLIGRTLIRTGDLVLQITTDNGRLALLPAQAWDVRGGPDPASWKYQITVAGPDKIETTATVPAESVLHFRYAYDPGRAWVGLGPITVASLGGKLSAEVAAALADEAAGPRGAFLQVPADGDDPTLSKLKGDIRGAKGQVLLAEGGDWDAAGTATAPWQTQRFGANPPLPLVELHKIASREVMLACGVPDTLFSDVGSASSREAYRLLLHSCIAPLGRLVAAELTAKLESPIVFGWAELAAADVASKARAFQSLVGGGMSLQDAAAASGILASDS